MVLDSPFPDHVVRIGATLSLELQNQVIDVLKANQDYFAWSHEDMTGISPDVITDKLNANLEHKPVKWKRCKFTPKPNQTIDDEVQKLINTRKVREVKYPDRLANVVMCNVSEGITHLTIRIIRNKEEYSIP